MILTTRQLAAILRVSKRTALYVVHRLSIPYDARPSGFAFDTESQSVFFASVRACIKDPNLKPYYSMRELGQLTGKSYRSAARLLVRLRAPTHHIGTKRIIFVTELLSLSPRSRNISTNKRYFRESL